MHLGEQISLLNYDKYIMFFLHTKSLGLDPYFLPCNTCLGLILKSVGCEETRLLGGSLTLSRLSSIKPPSFYPHLNFPNNWDERRWQQMVREIIFLTDYDDTPLQCLHSNRGWKGFMPLHSPSLAPPHQCPSTWCISHWSHMSCLWMNGHLVFWLLKCTV